MGVTGGSAVATTYGSSTFALNIGGGGIFDDTKRGSRQIDDVYVYERALTPEEVVSLMR